jgi:hypothetical protein
MTTTPDDMSKWQPLVACLEFNARNADQAWTVQTQSKDWDFGPYIQAQYVDDEIVAEITSNQFLQPHMSIHGEHRMQFLGWKKPWGYDYPNWYKVVPNTVDGHEQIAKLWVKTLLEVYCMDDRWRFEVAPLRIEYIRAWRWCMCDTRMVGTFRLTDRFGKTRDDQRAEIAQAIAQQKIWDELAREVRFVFIRAKSLGLAGTDLIRLAQCEFNKDVQKVVTELVYTGESEIGMVITSDDIKSLGLFSEIEFDELERVEFLEGRATFQERHPKSRVDLEMAKEYGFTPQQAEEMSLYL